MATVTEYLNAARKADAQGNEDDARRLVQAARRVMAEAERRRPTPEGFKVIGNDDNGGTVYARPDGKFQYVSPGGARIMDSIPQDLNMIAPQAREEMSRDVRSEFVGQRPIASGAAAAMQGVPFVGEWLDEAVGAVSPQAGANMRMAQEGMAQERPGLTTGLQIGTGIASAVPMLMAAPTGAMTMGAQSLGGRMLGGGLMGAALGGAEGVASQAGRNNEGPRMANTAQSGAAGAIIGGALGTAAEPVAQGLGAAYRRFAPGAARAARRGQQSLGLDETGARLVGEAAERDAPFAAENLANAGRFATVASTGPNTKRLLDWAVNRPGVGADAARQLDDMAETAGRDLVTALDDNLGAVQGPRATQRGIMEGSADARGEAYGAAYSTPIDYSADGARNLEGLLERVPARAVARAQELMRTEGVRSKQIKFDMDTETFSELPDVRTLDYLTRALRDMGDFGVGEGKEQGRAYMSLARDIRQQLDELVPAYRQARAEGRDAIANREAVDVGRQAFTQRMTFEELSDEVAGMGAAEREYLMNGARSYLDDVMARTKVALTDDNMDAREAVAPLKYLLSREGKNKVGVILGERADDFLTELRQIYEPLSLRANVAQNSKTQMRANAEAQLDDAVGPTFGEALAEGRGITGAASEVALPMMRAGAPTRSDRKAQVAEGIGRALLRPIGSQQEGLAAVMLRQNLLAAQQQAGLVGDAARRGVFATGLGSQPSRTTQGR